MLFFVNNVSFSVNKLTFFVDKCYYAVNILSIFVSNFIFMDYFQRFFLAFNITFLYY